MWNTVITKLTDRDENGNSVYIKRDDLIPLSFGGNKARKAVYFYGEIDAGDYDCVVTYGSSSSNHCRIISNMAAMRGMPCYIIGPKEASKPTFNSVMMELFGAEITVVAVDEVHDAIENKMRSLKASGRKPYFIAGGGHGILGTQAYVDCYEEICSYEKLNDIHFDYIFLASGTGTTHAGLVCGQLMHDDERRIVGISIARTNPRGRDIILDSIAEYLNSKNVQKSETDIDKATTFVDDYIVSGYGSNDGDIKAAIRSTLTEYGIALDSTYTGKAYSGMLKWIKDNKVRNGNILFIHTGGTPLFFDDLGEWI